MRFRANAGQRIALKVLYGTSLSGQAASEPNRTSLRPELYSNNLLSLIFKVGQAAPCTDVDSMRKEELAQFTVVELALLGSQVAIVVGVVFCLYLIVIG